MFSKAGFKRLGTDEPFFGIAGVEGIEKEFASYLWPGA